MQATQYRIIGSGPVALACALFMSRAGIDPRRVHLRLPPLADPRAARRTLAISDGSRQLLSRIITLPAGGVIERIEVAMIGRSGRTRIDARDFGVAALGHVVAYPDLVSALRAAVQEQPMAGEAANPDSRAADDFDVVIHADGVPGSSAGSGRAGSSRSPEGSGTQGRLATRPKRAIDTRDFGQAALLTEVVAAHAGTTAYECFGRHGPLALLPAGPHHNPRFAIVWCDEPELTRQRAALSPEALSAMLTQVVAEFRIPSSALGALTVCAPVEVAPLSRLRRIESAAGREVWIGNAAQALHPVAGQGLNLGLRDAFELARSLADNEYADTPSSAESVLARFASVRRFDRTVTTGATDLLASAFGWPLARPLQSALLTAMDILPPLRRPLASTLLFGRR